MTLHVTSFNQEVESQLVSVASVPLSKKSTPSSAHYHNIEAYPPPEAERWLLTVTELLPFPEEASESEKAELGVGNLTTRMSVYLDKVTKSRIPASILKQSKKGRALPRRAQRQRKQIMKARQQSGTLSSPPSVNAAASHDFADTTTATPTFKVCCFVMCDHFLIVFIVIFYV